MSDRTPRTEAGRLLLRNMVRANGSVVGRVSFDTKPEEWRAVILAIEAEAATPVPESLDVERLARAIVEHRILLWGKEPCTAECAPLIAAEYARLSKPSEGSET